MAEQQFIVITGANKGIGLATVEAILAHSEDTFVFLGSRSAERGSAARASVLKKQPNWEDRLAVLQIDVSDDDSVNTAAATVATKLAGAKLYGIVNNAGIGFPQGEIAPVLQVNTRGPRRVVNAFMNQLEPNNGRVVHVSSAAGPSFVAGCSDERQALLVSPKVTWEQVEEVAAECIEIEAGDGDFEARGLGAYNPYGLSKALLNAYVIESSKQNPNLKINACTPGFIETDLTLKYAEQHGKSPAELSMKTPKEGTRASMHLLFGDLEGNGWYYGSDAVRSPIDKYRGPGDPPYTGE